METPWILYIISNRQFTYVGVSPNPTRRLRQHNGEICGGAKYTTSKGAGWKHVCTVGGFRTKIEALQFEWAVKHIPPRDAGGIKNRIRKLFILCGKEKWTSNAPPSIEIPLCITWCVDDTTRLSLLPDIRLPDYITETHD
jgi:predicted GIY-YIG superfamily endonuclease